MSAIDKLILRNFKAFYSGTENYEVNFSGKHMLIYGENGSGKSSIYWSLYTLFQSENKTDAEIKKYFEPINDEQLVNYNYLLEHPSFEIDDEGKIKEPKSIGKNSEVEVILKNGVSLKINDRLLIFFYQIYVLSPHH
jgi:recombinational DNA repair ATPase RecF